jgi:hypothetical protein
MESNGRVFKSGTIIRAGEQLPTQARCIAAHRVLRAARSSLQFARCIVALYVALQTILAHCHPIVKKVWPTPQWSLPSTRPRATLRH